MSLFRYVTLIGIAGLLWQLNAQADEVVIQALGQIRVPSSKGEVALNLFYATNSASASDPMVLGLYWLAKPNSHQALLTWSSNNVVDLGDSLCGFNLVVQELFIFPGLTNVSNPSSEEEIRRWTVPVFERFKKGEDLGIGIRRLYPESLLPAHALMPLPITMGSHIQIAQVQPTVTNVTLILLGERRRQAELVMGKDLNVLTARKIADRIPEFPVRSLGKMDVVSAGGNSPLSVFMIGSPSPGKLPDLYWLTKPGSHLALVTQVTNHVVDLGENLCSFDTYREELVMVPAITNILNPLAVEEISSKCAAVFDELDPGHGLPGTKIIEPESMLELNALRTSRQRGFQIRIGNVAATSTNVSVELLGDNDRKAIVTLSVGSDLPAAR